MSSEQNNNVLKNINNFTPKKIILDDVPIDAAKTIVTGKKTNNPNDIVCTSYHVSKRVYDEFKRVVKVEGRLIRAVLNTLLDEFLSAEEPKVEHRVKQLDTRISRTVHITTNNHERLELFTNRSGIKQYAVIESLMISYILSVRSEEDSQQIILF